MSTFRYLIIDISGSVTGTNDESELPDVHDDDTAVTIVDTHSGTYTNEDEDAVTIEQYDGSDESDDDSSDD